MLNPATTNCIKPYKEVSLSRSERNQLLLRTVSEDAAFFTKTDVIMFVLLVGLFVMTRLWYLTFFAVDSDDEYFTMWAIRQNWRDMISSVVKDLVHPPLFYLVFKIWAGFGGKSLLWLSLFPVLVALGTIIPFYLLCRELNLRAAEMNLALALMTVNAYLVEYSQFLRMYTLLQFLSLCSYYLFIRFFNSNVCPNRYLVALSGVNLLLVFTHYYGWMVVGVEFIFLLFWGRPKLSSFTVSVAALILSFSPWVYAVWQAASPKDTPFTDHMGWLGRPTIFNVLWYYISLNGAFDFPRSASSAVVLFGYPVMLWAMRVLVGPKDGDSGQAVTFWFLILLSFLPTALAFSASQLLPLPVWHQRHLIIVSAPFMILVAIGVCQLRTYWVRTITLLLIVGWATLSGFYTLNLNREKQVQWDLLARQLIEVEPIQAKEIRVYSLDIRPALPLKFYLDWANEMRFQILVVKDTSIPAGNLFHWAAERGIQVVEVKDVAALEGNHFWLLYGSTTQEPLRSPRGTFIEKGCQVGESLKVSTPRQTVFLLPVWCRSSEYH